MREMKRIPSTPQLAPLPDKAEIRLIDIGMLLLGASRTGFSERYGRGQTPHTIHVWWARRPHSTMRALAFASLCKGCPEGALELVDKLCCSSQADKNHILAARELITKQYSHPPRVLDMFGGGGTIPLEFARLGAETFAIDSNQLSVFIQKCFLVNSQHISTNNVEHSVIESGTRVLNKLKRDTASLFPLRECQDPSLGRASVFGYLWTYSMMCSNCGFKFMLSRRPWLSKKKRNLALRLVTERLEQTCRIEEVPKDYRHPSNWIGRKGTVRCPKCETIHADIDIEEIPNELVGLISLPRNTNETKEFLAPMKKALPSERLITETERNVLKIINSDLPQTPLPRWSGIVNPAIYGVRTHADSLNPRQRVTLLLLVKALIEEYDNLCEVVDERTARYIICLLGGLVDQLVDWNCRFSMWISQNEQVGRAFCGPGVAMLWDYVETDPVQKGPANLWAKLDRIVNGTNAIGVFPHATHVEQAYAQFLPYESDYFDAILTDPPYYDNIYYDILADFFYVWKRLLFRNIEPALFRSETTDSAKELVASTFRSGTSEKAHNDYCRQLGLTLKEAYRVLRRNGVLTFIYGHSSLKGWEALVRAFRSTDFLITSIQPLTIERRQRPRAMTSKAVNTCIAFVAHKDGSNRNRVSTEAICREVGEICKDLGSNLSAAGWYEDDIAQASFANGVAMLANLRRTDESLSDLDTLRKIASLIQKHFPDFSVQDREPL